MKPFIQLCRHPDESDTLPSLAGCVASRGPVGIILVLFALLACATTPTVSTRVADGVVLEQYKTYTLETGPVRDVQGNVLAGNQTEIGRLLEKLVRDELERHGLKPVDHNADITFLYATARREKQWTEQKWPYEDRWPYQEGAADLLASDRMGRTIWLAHMQAVIDPKDVNHTQLKKAVARAFRKYPTVNPAIGL
jgi:hypothetical protein